MSQSDSICTFRWSYPIYYMFDQSLAYCCRTPTQYIAPQNIEKYGYEVFSKMDYFQDRREEMLNGKRHQDCSSCWKLEDQNIKSPRLNSNFQATLKSAQQLEAQTVENIKEISAPEILEIVLSNTCNAKCVYCNEFYSTAWLQEKQRTNSVMNTYRDKYRNLSMEKLFWEWVDKKAFPLLKRIGFIGGEPLLIPELYECLEKIDNFSIMTSNFKKEICITTNLSVSHFYIEKLVTQIKKMSNHFRFVIQVSLEATEEQTEYIRYGTKWILIQKNLDILFELKSVVDMEISFLPTLNILAIPTLDKFIKFVDSYVKKFGFEVKILNNSVTEPYMLSPTVLCADDAYLIQQAINLLSAMSNSENISTNQKNYYLDFHNYLSDLNLNLLNKDKRDIHQLQLLNLFLQKNDLLRSTKYENVFPEIAKILRGNDDD